MNMDIRKAQISVQTFFMILMGICFIWILIFGYKQITSINEQISEQDRVLITNDIKKALQYCSDPLNRGTEKVIIIEHKDINGICYINSSKTLPNEIISFNSEILPIIEGNHNILLLNNKYSLTSQVYVIDELQIVGSSFVESEIINSKCWLANENKNKVLIDFVC